MPSKWGERLDTKLNGLAGTASKDSILTFSNWITFNRKHFSTIVPSLLKCLEDKDSTKQSMYWKLVHQILINGKDGASLDRWEQRGPLRVALGEGLLQAAMKETSNGPSIMSLPKDEFESSLQEWEEMNVFGGPSLVSQIRRLYQGKNDSGNDNETPVVEAQEEVPEEASPPPVPETPKETAPLTRPASPVSASKKSGTISVPVDYDFESKGIPASNVEAREFLDPCKAITTLQIARDVRTNTALEISTALSNLPPNIWQACEDLDSQKLEELDNAKINEFSVSIPSNLLDIDMEEETQSLNMFQDIVQRQEKAREKLIALLVQSRCNFGSKETAKAFHELSADDTDLFRKIQARKEVVRDALELEGLDTNEIEAPNQQKREEPLPPLEWYEHTSHKKQKLA